MRVVKMFAMFATCIWQRSASKSRVRDFRQPASQRRLPLTSHQPTKRPSHKAAASMTELSTSIMQTAWSQATSQNMDSAIAASSSMNHQFANNATS